jgi:tetratricopeptide (TPR) repeat protein
VSGDYPDAGQGLLLPPPEEETAGAARVAAGDDLLRRVAVLIMVVTLIGAVFAFLQAAATNRAGRATRASDAAALNSMAELARARGHLSVEDQMWILAWEEGALTLGLGAAGDDGYAGNLAAAHSAARLALLSYSDLSDPAYQRDDGTADSELFLHRTLAPAYTAGEFQKAYAAERDAWGAKGGAYVAVVTVLAVSLFLIGLSRTVGAGSGGPLVLGGVLLAATASLWGVSVFARPVAGTSAAAIEAYVEGTVAFNSVLREDDPRWLEERLTRAEEAFTRAIEARPNYLEAYLGRGSARFRLDLLRPGGPQGSVGARDDYERAVRLDLFDPFAWGNLGAARFWLGDLEGAEAATRRALELDPGDPVFNLNLGLALTLGDDVAAYEAQVGRIGEIMAADPAWWRQLYLTTYLSVLDLAERYRPDYAQDVRRFREDARRIDHQVSVAKRFFGTAVPAPVSTQVSPLSFTLSADGTLLEATFNVTGVAPGARWLWRTYLDDVERDDLSAEPEAWPFALPDDEVVITLTQPDGFTPGVLVRVEVFIEGNLLQAGEFVP